MCWNHRKNAEFLMNRILGSRIAKEAEQSFGKYLNKELFFSHFWDDALCLDFGRQQQPQQQERHLGEDTATQKAGMTEDQKSPTIFITPASQSVEIIDWSPALHLSVTYGNAATCASRAMRFKMSNPLKATRTVDELCHWCRSRGPTKNRVCAWSEGWPQGLQQRHAVSQN